MWKRSLGLLSDAATYGASSATMQVVGFLLLPLYTRHLSPEDYGVIAMLAMTNLLFGAIANLGIQNAIFRNFNRTDDPQRRRDVLSTGLLSVTISSVLFFALCWPFAGFIGDALVGDLSRPDYVLISLATGAMATVGNVPFAVLRALRRVKMAGALNILKVAVTAGVTIVLVVYLKMGVLGVLWANLISELILLVIKLAITFQSYQLRMDMGVLREMLAYGLPYVPNGLQATALHYFGQYVLAHMLSLQEAGLYNVAMKFSAPLAFVVQAIQQAYVPHKFEIHAQEKDPQSLFRSITTYYFAGTFYLWLGVSLWGPESVRFLTSHRFHAAALQIPFAAAVPLARGFRFMLGTGMEVVDDQRPVPFVSAVGLAVVVASSFWLVGEFGGAGAALAPVIGWLVMAGMIYYFAQKRFRVSYDWPALIAFGTLAIGGVVLGRFVSGSPAVLRFAILVAISLAYPILAYVALVRSPAEGARVRGMVLRVRRKVIGEPSA